MCGFHIFSTYSRVYASNGIFGEKQCDQLYKIDFFGRHCDDLAGGRRLCHHSFHKLKIVGVYYTQVD
jgi:hypothetical protein